MFALPMSGYAKPGDSQAESFAVFARIRPHNDQSATRTPSDLRVVQRFGLKRTVHARNLEFVLDCAPLQPSLLRLQRCVRRARARLNYRQPHCSQGCGTRRTRKRKYTRVVSANASHGCCMVSTQPYLPTARRGRGKRAPRLASAPTQRPPGYRRRSPNAEQAYHVWP